MNAREELFEAADWLGWQTEDLAAGLKSAEDGLKLWRYWQSHPNLPEMADDQYDDDGLDLSAERVKALGYDPLAG